jgi:transposase
MEIRSDRQKGMSFAEIARKYHLDPRTAKKYALSETKPVYKLSQSKAFYICS